MPVALNRTPILETPTAPISPWQHIAWLGAAVLFVWVLALTRGLDLSPGFF